MTASTENNLPQQIQSLLDGFNDHNNPLFWLRLVPAIIFGAYIIQRYVSALINQPKFTKQDVVYQEYFAAGGSLKNILTKMGSASNCLRLVVTHDLLWVTSWFPFSIFAAVYDMEHVIPLRSIQSIEGKKTMGVQSLVLTYADDRGTGHSLRLGPKNTAAFLDALETSSARTGTMIPAANVVSEEPIPTLGVALKKYWYHLVPMGLFPIAASSTDRYLHVPFGAFIPVFFAVIVYAEWPIITKKVPYSYQFVMMAVWMGGAVLAGLVMQIISMFFGSHHQ